MPQKCWALPGKLPQNGWHTHGKRPSSSMRTSTTACWALHRVEERRFGSLGPGVSTHPINKVMEDTNVTAASTAGSHNGEHEDSATPPVHYTNNTLHTHHTSEHEVRATPRVHYTNSTLHTHHTSHTHYIPEIQAPQRPAGGSTKVPEGQQAGSRRPRSPDTRATTRRTRARHCEHKTDSKQCQDVSLSQQNRTAAQGHHEFPCALSQARDQADDGCSSTWAAAQSPVAMQLPLNTLSI